MRDIQARRPREHGQIIVLFALGLVALIAMVGLVLDGSGTYAQRRSEQNSSDLAALAGANDYLLNNNAASAIARARTVASLNGFTDGVGGTTVNVTIDTSNGANVKVDIQSPHANGFASVVGMSAWTVATTATAVTGFPDTADGAAPIIFSIHAFGTDGTPLSQYSNPAHPFAFGDGNGDVPNDATDIAWTNYGTGNVDTNEVRQIIQGNEIINKTLAFGEYIGQHNNGNHTALFSDVDQYLDGLDVPVPIVDDNGNFQGWATFHIVSADGGPSKTITGYFRSSFVSQRLTIDSCTAGSCPRFLGSYVLKLTN
jgi:Flp pilus assembly protein TadG